MFLKLLYVCKKYRQLLIIDYVKNNKWIINIPSQPRNDIWNHTNDSFRELAYLCSLKNNDLKKKISNRMKDYVPHLIKDLGLIKGANFKKLFDNAIKLVDKHHDKKNIKWIGWMDSWIEEFFPIYCHLLY